MKAVPSHIEKMDKNELITYLDKFIAAILSDEGGEVSPEAHEFVCLYQKIITELSRQRIYKVSTVDVSDIASSGVKEYSTKYFGSLNAAKRELKRRFQEQRRNFFVAQPYEVQDFGLCTGICPSLVQSIVTNRDVPLTAPGRYKFYEVRMYQDSKIIPIQFMLTSIDAAPAQLPSGSSKRRRRTGGPTGVPDSIGRGSIIPFESLRMLMR